MKRLAIYPGSFNPFTVGHQNILEKAEKMFDEVIVAVGVNPEKLSFTIDNGNKEEWIANALKEMLKSKVDILKQQLPSKKIEGYVGFLTEFVREKQLEGDYDEVIIIRGLRNGHDYDYEYNQTRYMWDQFPGMNIVCLFCDPLYAHVSSSAYRALEKVKPGSGHKYLAREIEDTSKVTTEMVEEQLSVVVVLDEETPQMLQKYDIIPFESDKEYAFKGTYAQCLDWIKEKEKSDEQKRK